MIEKMIRHATSRVIDGLLCSCRIHERSLTGRFKRCGRNPSVGNNQSGMPSFWWSLPLSSGTLMNFASTASEHHQHHLVLEYIAFGWPIATQAHNEQRHLAEEESDALTRSCQPMRCKKQKFTTTISKTTESWDE